MEPDEQKKEYLRGVSVGFTMGITKVEKTYVPQTVFEHITENPRTLAEFIVSDPCLRNPKKSCEEGMDCKACMLDFITDRLREPAEILNADKLCNAAGEAGR